MALDDRPEGNPALVRLCGWLADPAGWYQGATGLDADHRAMLADSPVLRPLLNRWLAEQSGARAFAPDASLVTDLAQDAETGQVVALMTRPDAELLQVAQVFGAALWVEPLRMAVLRSDREWLASQLGPEAMAFGLRRAPVFARALADLPLARSAPDPVAAGYALCGALVARARRGLFDLFRLRRPDLPDPVALTDRQAQTAWAILDLQGLAS